MPGGASIEGTLHAMVTEIRANVIVSGGGGGEGVVFQDSQGRRGDPLSFSNLDLDDIFFIYS